MKIHNHVHVFVKYGYQKLDISLKNKTGGILHILTLNKEDEVTFSNNIKQIFGEIRTSKLHLEKQLV